LTLLKYWIFCKLPIPSDPDLLITAKWESPTAKFNYEGALRNSTLELSIHYSHHKKATMKRILLSAVVLTTYISSFAQNDSTGEIKKHAPNLATVHTIEGKTLKGWFYRLDDDQVILLPAGSKKFNLASLANPGITDNTINIGVDQIQSISLRKKNSVLKGALIGLGIGALTGVIAGFVSGDDPVQPYNSGQDPYSALGNVFIAFDNSFAMTAGEKAAGGAILLGGTGAIIGTIVGAIAKKKFIIGGKKEVYRDLQGDLMKRLIVQ
jgi:hypothetical protein